MIIAYSIFIILLIIGLRQAYISKNFNYIKLNKFLRYNLYMYDNNEKRYYLDLTDEIQLLYVFLTLHDLDRTYFDFVPIIKANRNLCFNIDVYYKDNKPVERIKEDIKNIEYIFYDIISKCFIEVYKKITSFENSNFEQTIENYKQKCENFKIKKDLSFLKYNTSFIKNLKKIHSLRNFKYEKKQTQYILKNSNIPILFNHNWERIFGHILFFNIKQPNYQATYIRHNNELKLIEENLEHSL